MKFSFLSSKQLIAQRWARTSSRAAIFYEEITVEEGIPADKRWFWNGGIANELRGNVWNSVVRSYVACREPGRWKIPRGNACCFAPPTWISFPRNSVYVHVCSRHRDLTLCHPRPNRINCGPFFFFRYYKPKRLFESNGEFRSNIAMHSSIDPGNFARSYLSVFL